MARSHGPSPPPFPRLQTALLSLCAHLEAPPSTATRAARRLALRLPPTAPVPLARAHAPPPGPAVPSAVKAPLLVVKRRVFSGATDCFPFNRASTALALSAPLASPRQASAPGPHHSAAWLLVSSCILSKRISFSSALLIIAANVLAGFTLFTGIFYNSFVYNVITVPNVTYCAIRCNFDQACNSFMFKSATLCCSCFCLC